MEAFCVCCSAETIFITRDGFGYCSYKCLDADLAIRACIEVVIGGGSITAERDKLKMKYGEPAPSVIEVSGGAKAMTNKNGFPVK